MKKTITSRDWISVIHIFVEPRYLDYKALKKVMKTGEGEAGSLWYTKNRWCDVKMGPEIYVVYMIIYDMCSIYVDIFRCTSCGKLFHVFFIWFLCVCVCHELTINISQSQPLTGCTSVEQPVSAVVFMTGIGTGPNTHAVVPEWSGSVTWRIIPVSS